MFGINGYEAFVISSILLNMTPGSDTIYILSKSATGGRKCGMASALGISAGIFIHTVLAALGLSVILAQSPLCFNIMKFLGAGYLIWMGIKIFFSKKSPFEAADTGKEESLMVVFRQGVFTNVLNPKVALFFLALLPQFVSDSSEYGPLPFLILGFTFFITSTVWSLMLAHVASYFNRLLARNRKVQTASGKFSGIIYMLLGLNILRARVN